MGAMDTDHTNLIKILCELDLFVYVSGDASEPIIARDFLTLTCVFKVIDFLVPFISMIVLAGVRKIKDARKLHIVLFFVMALDLTASKPFIWKVVWVKFLIHWALEANYINFLSQLNWNPKFWIICPFDVTLWPLEVLGIMNFTLRLLLLNNIKLWNGSIQSLLSELSGSV
jgi:hypothetical protein